MLHLVDCPSVTEAMAKTCINDDPKCSAVPSESDDNCFSGAISHVQVSRKNVLTFLITVCFEKKPH